MSLRGRYLIDRVKQTISRHFKLPVPPYGDPGYWDAAYKSFGPQDSFEWGDVTLSDLMEYRCQSVEWTGESQLGSTKSTTRTTSLGETLSTHPNAEQDEPLLMLGCGNSKMGEEMIHQGWRGPMIQVDVSSRVVESLSQRCGPLITDGHMNFVQDDATELSAFSSGMVSACIDKGLMDAIYCADEYEQCGQVLSSVHRVLKPGGVFCVLSFSRPQFFLKNIWMPPNHNARNRGPARLPVWESVKIQELDKIMLYRFEKSREEATSGPLRVRNSKKSKRQRKSN